MAEKAAGTTLKITPAGGTQKTVGVLTSIGRLNMDSEMIDVTTLDATGGFKQYIQGPREAGELSVSGYHLSSDAGQSALRAAYLSGTVCACVIAFPGGTTVSFSALVRSVGIGAAEVGGAVGFSAALRLTGGVTYA